MEPVLVVLGVLVAAGVWWLTRRRKQLLQEGFPDTASEPEPDEGPPQVLRRSMLEQSRSFDPSAWDNTPTPTPTAAAGMTTGRSPTRATAQVTTCPASSTATTCAARARPRAATDPPSVGVFGGLATNVGRRR